MWDVLAIAPTDDARAIRRAYAARLREINPDRDREAFARLRAALEWALADAFRTMRRAPLQPPRDESPFDGPLLPEWLDDGPPQAIHTVHLSWTPEPPTPEVVSERPPKLSAPDVVPEAASERATERALLIALESALQQRDARAAMRLYFRAAATGAVPLGDTERMLVRLFTVALEDGRFNGAAFRTLAKSLGWDQPRLDSPAVSDVRQRVLARLAAEDWYDNLVATGARKSKSKNRRTPRFEARVARLIVRRAGGVGLLRIHRQTLRVYLDRLKPHHAWLRDRIPPEWIAILERRIRRRGLIATGLIGLFIGGLLLNIGVVLIVEAARDGASPALPVLGVVAVLLAWVFKNLVVNFVTLWRQRAP